MRASRLLSILILLQMRGRLSAETLAREFEVSVRTIYRDIDQLSAAGVPVYAERGRAGGFQLMDGYRTRLTGFTPGEAEALLLAGVGGAAADLGLDAELAAAQLKLMASLPADAGASAQRVAERFHLDPAPWYRAEPAADLLPALAQAVWGQRKVRMAYESWSAQVERLAEPLGLVLKGGAWYLAARVDRSLRTYRISNIQGLAVLAETFERPRGFDLARWWADWARAFEARLLKDRAMVRLSAEGAWRLAQTNPAAARAVEAAHPDGVEGWATVEIPMESGAFAARQLLQLGDQVEVLAPPELRAAVAEEAKALAGLYGVA